ncbi:hypothetical protein LTS10_005265 [Elasticomyces elasticus]|nr:hypothetical protein LTS10_005265 [Elasticomyces elasticus]
MARKTTYAIILASVSLLLLRWLTMSTQQSSQGSSPYDEAEFLGLITEIYQVLLRLGHIKPDRMVWAPPTGHDINLSVLENPNGIDERVVSLMRKLPAGPHACVDPYMRPVIFLNDGELMRSRDIDKRASGLDYRAHIDQSNALPTVLLLWTGFESTDPVLVLDVADNTVRYFDEVYNGPHYLNYPAEHAPTYLKHVLENYRDGIWVPDNDAGVFETDKREPSWGPELRRTLVEDYKWPGEGFRQDAWRNDVHTIIGRLMELDE